MDIFYFNPWHIWAYLAAELSDMSLREALMPVGLVGAMFTRPGAPQAELLPVGWQMTIHCCFLSLMLLAPASLFKTLGELVEASDVQPSSPEKQVEDHHKKAA